MDPQFQEAVRLHQAGNIAAASQRYQEILKRNPRDVNALCSLAFCCFQTGQYADSERLFGIALGLNPTDLNALCMRGVALMQLTQFQEGLACFDAALALRHDFPGALTNRATALMELGRHEEALAGFERALSVAPGDVNAMNNRGNALLLLGRPLEALTSYESTLSLNPSHAEAWFNRGNALTELMRLKDALKSYDQSLSLRASHAPAWYRRGLVLLWLAQPEGAATSFDRALAISPNIAPLALRARSQAYLELGRYPDAIADCEALLRIDPDMPYVRGDASHWRRSCCAWHLWEQDQKERLEGASTGKSVVNPWVAIGSCTAPAEQLHWSRHWSGDVMAQVTPLPPAPRREHARLRIAYLSADLRGHVVSNLMIKIFERHDRTRFEILGVSFDQPDQSEPEGNLEKTFDRFINVSGKRDEDAAALLRELEVDIAVDLMGFTTDSRPGILARRPAPVQASYLGFAGTMGASWIDYLIADPVVIPQQDRPHYDESIAYLPDTYHPYDGGTLAQPAPTRAKAGLPETGFVFSCFHNSYKITPDIFAVWMRLLAAVPGSVIWLREKNAFAAGNLRREAEKHGVAPDRLIFAPVFPSRDDYRAALALADLFLDTLPYNAHTTTADALWAGVPVITCTGTTFAGRVATSMLTACGLSETVTSSLEEYEALALKLARDPATLGRLREKVEHARRTSPLFNPARLCRHLETAFTMMWERHRKGLAPADLAIPAESRGDA